MWAIVEQVYEKKLFLVGDDQKRIVFINNSNYDIKENNYINIINGEIVEVKPYNEELYKNIKELEKEIFSK